MDVSTVHLLAKLGSCQDESNLEVTSQDEFDEQVRFLFQALVAEYLSRLMSGLLPALHHILNSHQQMNSYSFLDGELWQLIIVSECIAQYQHENVSHYIALCVNPTYKANMITTKTTSFR